DRQLPALGDGVRDPRAGRGDPRAGPAPAPCAGDKVFGASRGALHPARIAAGAGAVARAPARRGSSERNPRIAIAKSVCNISLQRVLSWRAPVVGAVRRRGMNVVRESGTVIVLA